MAYDPRYITNPDGSRHGEVVGAERTPNGKLLVEWADDTRTWHSRSELLRDTERSGTVETGLDAPVPLRVACTLDDGADRPAYARAGDAGLDLTSMTMTTVPAGLWQMVRTGVRVALPPGYAGLITPRSGLAWQHGVTILNAPGLIDSGFRGEIGVLLQNHGKVPFEVHAGDRVAQLVVIRVAQAELFAVDTLPASVRAEGGFGSTGR